MKNRFRCTIFFVLFLYAFNCIAQVDAYEYRTPILEAKKGWNTVTLPLDIFAKSKNELFDIRIYNLDKGSNKSIEQPYILDIQEAKKSNIETALKILNPTKTKSEYSYTFESSNKETINNIHLNFSNQIYDWKIHLEGSMDQVGWSTIAKDYRIVSFKNRETNFTYSDLSIPDSRFNFYKISFNSDYPATLKSATWSKKIKSDANYLSYPIQNFKIEEDDKLKSTTIEIDLGKKLPISQIELICNTENEYYRPFIVEGVVDSFETETGWHYRYNSLYQGTVNSINKNKFQFYNKLHQKLRITIKNFDNLPLSFSDYKVSGPNYRLITRLTNSENLYLCYGNSETKKPLYDISFFKDKIPTELNATTLAEAEYHPTGVEESSPLFKNKWWLWGIMIFVIVLLGTFTLKMVREGK